MAQGIPAEADGSRAGNEHGTVALNGTGEGDFLIADDGKGTGPARVAQGSGKTGGRFPVADARHAHHQGAIIRQAAPLGSHKGHGGGNGFADAGGVRAVYIEGPKGRGGHG